MAELSSELVRQLISLIDELRGSTAGFLDHADDQQMWYDRGYANGIVLALQALGQTEYLEDRLPDNIAELDVHLPMTWGKAYRHGETMGSRETYEITGTQSQ